MTIEKTLEFIKIDERLQVKIYGDIDHHSAKIIRERIDESILKEKPKVVFLYLGAVEFMDSSGLGLILGRYNTAKEIGAEFLLESPNKKVKKILDIAGLGRIIKIVEGQNDL